MDQTGARQQVLDFRGGFVGGAANHKNILLLLLAVRQEGLDAVAAHVAGNHQSVAGKPLRIPKDGFSSIKELAGDDDRIIFTGFVQGVTRKELYDNAYVYVLPSDVEGMPLSLLEAMSYRNCCLTSDIPECTEVVGDKALSFQKGNVKDLRAKLQTLCENPHIVKEYQEQSADYICEKYNWEYVVDETTKLYEEN